MADSIKEEEKCLPPSPSGEEGLGKTTREVALAKDGFSVHPQPVRDDPLDPLNWPPFQKNTILAIVMALCVLTFLHTSSFLPAGKADA